MNANLHKLQPYPFEKLRKLTADVTPADAPAIAWSMGEPKHDAPEFLHSVLTAQLGGYSKYPATAGLSELKAAIGGWLKKRFQLTRTETQLAQQHTLPVTGTREALFSIVQALFDQNRTAKQVWMPNPFYQIYEGAALLAGGEPRFLNCTPENDYIPDYASISDEEWQQCQMLFICTPGNPSGAVMSVAQMNFLIRKSLEHDFILISDECYSELYRDEDTPPPGLLQAAESSNNPEYRNCLVFHSLSKRSNLPGLRSGFVAGDAQLLKAFLQYRTYHGCAMPIPHQQVSIAAWQDEQHVIENRRLYNEKFQAVTDILGGSLPLQIPQASFYLWPNLQQDDEQIAREWLQKANIHVLPGQYLSRDSDGTNPGFGHVRIALVATLDECVEAALRLKKIL